MAERALRDYRWRGSDAFVGRADANLFFWYYGTLATFRLGGEPWERWNSALKQALLPSQQADGSWAAIDLYARDYAGDREGDLSCSTALCVLSLEVYYRYFTPCCLCVEGSARCVRPTAEARSRRGGPRRKKQKESGGRARRGAFGAPAR